MVLMLWRIGLRWLYRRPVFHWYGSSQIRPAFWNNLPPVSQHQVAQMLALIRRMPPDAPAARDQFDVGYSESGRPAFKFRLRVVRQSSIN